jgi:hypothetical protein
MNIVDMLKSQITGAATEKIGGLIGVSPDQAKAATGAAIPSLLAGMAHLSSTPDGARKLDAAVDQADASSWSNPMAALSRLSGGASEGEGGVLGSLLGGNAVSGLSGAIGKFTGLGGGSIMSLLGMLGPLVLGFLKGQKQTLGLDAGGLSSLLASQKSNIASAMPAGLGSVLSGIPGLGSLSGAADATRAAAANAYDRGRDTLIDTAHGARDAMRAATPSPARWAVPLAILVALGALAWWMSSRPATTPVAVNPPAPVAPAPAPVAPAPAPMAAAPKSTVDDKLGNAAETAKAAIPASAGEVSTQVSDFFKSTSQTLGTITDASSAEAALPKLRDLSTKFDTIRTATDALPLDARGGITSAVKASQSGLQTTVDKLMAIPGVSDKIKPVVDDLMKKINTFAGQ